MHQEIAFRVALVAAGDRGDAEEAAQDAFVKAYRALGRFREGSPFLPWLLRIVANEARNRRRSAGRRAGLALRAAAVVSGDGAASPQTTPPAPSVRPARRPAARRRLRASFATIRRSQGRNGDPSRNRPSAR